MGLRASLLLMRARWVVLAFAAALFALYARALPGLVPDGSVERIMLKNDPERIFNDEARRTFGADELLVVAIPAPEGVFRQAYLETIDRVTRKLEKLDRVARVYSLTNYEVITGADAELHYPEVIEKVRAGWPLEQLRRYAHSQNLLRRNVVALDEKVSAINLRLEPSVRDVLGAKAEVVTSVRTLLSQELGAGAYWIAGWPSVQSDITRLMDADLQVLVPMAFLVITVLLVVVFGRPAGVFLPLLAVLLSIVGTMGTIALTGRTTSILTNALPVMIIAVSTTFSIYLVSAILAALAAERDRQRAVAGALAHTAPSILLSATTTAIGFLCLRFNSVEAIAEFGLFAAAGVGLSVVVTLMVVPCLAAVVPIRPVYTPRLDWLGRKLEPARLLPALLTRKGRVVSMTVTLLLIAASAVGIARVRIESDPVSWFRPDSETYRAAHYINDNLVGITPYSVIIEAPKPEGILEPALLRRIEELQARLAKHPEVDSAVSMVDLLKNMVSALHDNDPRQHRVPDNRAAVAQTILLYESDGLETLLSRDHRRANVIVRSNILSSERGVAFARELNAELARMFPPELATARITGSAYLAYKTNLEFTGGLAQSLAMSAVLICLVMMVVARSMRLGLLAMFPNAVPIAANYAILGWTGITLNAGTSITGCIAMGMAVDDTIHFVTSFRDRMRQRANVAVALDLALRDVGRPMVSNTFCLSLGFSVFLFSNFKPLASLGLLVAITMGVAVVCELLLMPNLLILAQRGLRREIAGAGPERETMTTGKVSLNPEQKAGINRLGAGAVLLFGLLAAGGPAQARELEAKEIVDRLTERNAVGFKQGVAEMRLILQPDGGEKRERRFVTKTMFDDGKTTSKIRFLAPADVEGSAFLLRERGEGQEDELFVYLPAFKRTRRLSGGQKSAPFMGSDVSYADLEFFDIKDAQLEKRGEATIDGVPCYLLVARPNSKDRYGHIEVWVRKDGFLAQQMKFYDPKGTLTKIFRLQEARREGDSWVAVRSQVWDKSKRHSTFMLVDSLTTKRPAGDAEFTPEALARP